jgi:polar amino acid transport system permease protein
MTFQQVALSLAEGFLENCRLFIETLLFSIPLGLIISFGSMSKFKPLSMLIKVIVWCIRGTPLMLQLFVVFYVPGLVFGVPMRNRMLAALVAFVINYACYFSEIFRGGIESISKGQYEAGQVLGLSKSQIFFKIILLQVTKRIMPPMSNEIITLVKDTSLARVIAVSEILLAAERFAGKGLIWPLFFTGVYFLVFCGGLTLLFGYIEKKMSYFN